MNHVTPLISSVQCSHQHFSQLKHHQIQQRNKESWHSKSECKEFFFLWFTSNISIPDQPHGGLKAVLSDWVSKGKQGRFATHPGAFSWNIAGRKRGQVWDQNNHKCHQAASLTCLQRERSTWKNVKKDLLDTHSAWHHCPTASKEGTESPADFRKYQRGISPTQQRSHSQCCLTKLFRVRHKQELPRHHYLWFLWERQGQAYQKTYLSNPDHKHHTALAATHRAKSSSSTTCFRQGNSEVHLQLQMLQDYLTPGPHCRWDIQEGHAHEKSEASPPLRGREVLV